MDNEKTLAALVAMAPNLVYTKCDEENNFRITTAYKDKAENVHTRFSEAYDCIEVWEKLSKVLTTKCLPACIQIGNTLFQPHYLQRIILFVDERAFFVALDFGGKHNIAYGKNTRAEQMEMYKDLVSVLGDRVEEGEDPIDPLIH